MPSFMTPEEDLPASASPGLDTLPAMGEMAGPSASSTEPDMSGFILPSSKAAPKTSGLGLAEFKSARGSDDDEYIKSLPTHKKIGLALQAFGAAVNGQANPIDVLLENKRKREAEFRQELGATTQLIKGGIDMVKKIPPGPARNALVDMIARQAGAGGETVRNALMAVGTEAEADLNDVVSSLDSPQARAMFVKTVSKSDNPRAEAMKLLGDKDFMDRLIRTADNEAAPKVLAKLNVVSQALAKSPEYASGDRARFTLADLTEKNKEFGEYAFTPPELAMLRRDPTLGIRYGMVTPGNEEKEQGRKAEGPKSSLGQLKEDFMDGAINAQEYEAGKAKLLERGVNAEKIADPSDPQKTIVVDANTGRKIGDAPTGEKSAIRMDNDVKQLSQRFESSKLNAVSSVLSNAEKMIEADPSVMSYVTGPKTFIPDAVLSKKVTDARQAVDKLFNIELKDRSGAAVTVPEFERLKNEYGKGAFKKPEQLVSAIKQARSLITSHAKSVAAGFSPDVVSAYNDNLKAVGGTPLFEMGGGIPTVANDADFKALKSGTVFIAPDGTKRKKP